MKIFGYEIWASRTRYITPLSLRFWAYRNWMGGMVFGVRLFGYKWECGYYERNLTRREPDDGDSFAETELSNDELDSDYQLWSNM